MNQIIGIVAGASMETSVHNPSPDLIQKLRAQSRHYRAERDRQWAEREATINRIQAMTRRSRIEWVRTETAKLMAGAPGFRTAIHEAGHALGALVGSIAMTHIEIWKRPDNTWGGQANAFGVQNRRYGIMVLCGPVADAMFRASKDIRLEGTDRVLVRQCLAGEGCEVTLADVETARLYAGWLAEARRLCAANWPGIQRVAAALRRSSNLTLSTPKIKDAFGTIRK